MQNLILQSNAKINLSLDILGVELNGEKAGYHYIRSIFCEINSENTKDFKPDTIFLKVSRSKKNEIIYPKKFNTLYKSADLILKKYCNVSPKKIEIQIEKNIPISSGLGGGSGNGATILKGLNKILNLNLNDKELENLASEISMDSPFFIKGGIALIEGFGELVTPLTNIENLKFLLFPKSGAQNKTTTKYSELDLEKCGKEIKKTNTLITAIKEKDLEKIQPNLHNDFETLLEKPLKTNVHLTGAGPSQFMLQM